MFKLLPSDYKYFADFVGSDMVMNAWKGNMLQKGMTHIREREMKPGMSTSEWLNLLNYMDSAIDLIHKPEVVDRFQTANARLYLAFKNPSAAACGLPEDYGENYTNWIKNGLNSQSDEIKELYSEIIRDRVKPGNLGGDDLDKYKALTRVCIQKDTTL